MEFCASSIRKTSSLNLSPLLFHSLISLATPLGFLPYISLLPSLPTSLKFKGRLPLGLSRPITWARNCPPPSLLQEPITNQRTLNFPKSVASVPVPVSPSETAAKVLVWQLRSNHIALRRFCKGSNHAPCIPISYAAPSAVHTPHMAPLQLQMSHVVPPSLLTVTN